MSYNLLTIYNPSNSLEDDSLYPIFDDNWTLKLDKGEEIVWSGKVSDLTLGINGIKKWELRGVDITITNQRIVYVCHKFKKGSRWWGMGLGAIFALLMIIITSALAAFQRQGKAAVGQVRYQWPRVVMQETCKNVDLFGNANLVNIMVANEHQQKMMLKFGMDKQMCDEATKKLLHYIAQFRINREFSSKNFPNEDPKRLEEAKAKLSERLTTKSKSEETNVKIVDYYEISKTSLPVPQLV